MTSIPKAKPAAVAPVRPSRYQRGLIPSYAVGRVCADAGCRTRLSRFNSSELCYLHANQPTTVTPAEAS